MEARITSTALLEDWARRVAEASSELPAEAQRIAVQTFRLLAQGEPVSTKQLSQSAEVSGEQIERMLRSHPEVLWDDQDRVVGFLGLDTRRITPTHAMQVGEVTVYAWCAWDTLFITEILRQETKVESTDPANGATIRLTVTPEGVADVEPSEAVVSLLTPERSFGEDAIETFCHRIHFFTSPESAEGWMVDRPGLFTVTVDEAFRLGQMVNQLRLGSVINGPVSGT